MNPKGTKAVLPGSSQHSIGDPKVKVTPVQVREMSEMLGIYFCDFDKYKDCRNSEDVSNKAITSV